MTNQPLRIIEILGRSEQGITKPFFCRAEDGESYYVKGNFAGFRALCCEWVAGELARHWGLPIAPFSIVEVPDALIKGSLRNDIFELGPGPAFGSRLVQNAGELRWAEVEGNQISADLRARVLIFDWWVANSDRMMSDVGGNPNLLWSPSSSHLSLIDHNLAFSTNLTLASLPEFAALHVFGTRILAQEMAFWECETAMAPLLQATAQLTQFWDDNPVLLDEIEAGLPEEWTETAPGFRGEVRSVLERVERDDFWGTEDDSEQS